MISDLVFWATVFWQEHEPSEKRGEIGAAFLPLEGAEAIAVAMTDLGHEMTAQDVENIYRRRL